MHMVKIDSHCQQQKCLAGSLVSGSTSFVRIFSGFSGQEAWNDSGWSKTAISSALSAAISSEALEIKPTLLYSHI